MPDQHIELSKEGIKISYLRFLSDSAAGQIVILTAVAAYYFPVFGTSLQQSVKVGISTEVKILVIVLLILLSTPLGLAINSASWFLLSWLQIGMQQFWFKERKLRGRPLFKHIREEFEIEETKKIFHLSDDDWYVRSQFIKQTLHIYHPHIINSVDHIRGIRTLFRNISFLALFFFAASLFFNFGNLNRGYILSLAFWCGLLFVAPMIVSSFLGFYHTSHILYRAYILCLAAKSDYTFKENFRKKVVSALATEVKPTT